MMSGINLFLKHFLAGLYGILIYPFRARKVIIMVDGGICSQMNQIILGRIFEQQGENVFYDFEFYRRSGKDLTGNFVRNFDLLKLFPDLKLRRANRIESRYYRFKYNVKGNYLENESDFSFFLKKAPIYLGDYYKVPSDKWLYTFKSTFCFSSLSPDVVIKPLIDEIISSEASVAVHVRRGDLSSNVVGYGIPATKEYFYRAIDFFKRLFPNPKFYFFSDEPEWVRRSLLPFLHAEISCKVIDINGSDKGYLDLILISACKHQITSKGSLGKYGALLRDNDGKYVVLCDDPIERYWGDKFKRPVYL